MKKIKTFFFSLTLSSALFSSQLCAIDASNTTYGVEVFGEYLYWKVTQDQMQYAAVLPGGIQPIIDEINSGSEFDICEKIIIKEPKFDYISGFRIGAAYHVPCTNWDALIAWDHLSEKVSSNVFDPDYGVIPLTLPASSIFEFVNRDADEFSFGNKATDSWRFDFNTIDIEIGTTFTLMDVFNVRPYCGLKFASIKQKQHTNYYGFSIDDVPVWIQNLKKNDFDGIGSLFGLCSTWEFMPTVNFTSIVSGCFLVGKVNVKETSSIMEASNSVTIKLKDSKKSRMRPMIDATIGIDWTPNYFCNVDIDIGIYYEMQYWWNQWQAPTSIQNSLLGGGSSPQGDLMMQGVTLGLDIAF